MKKDANMLVHLPLPSSLKRKSNSKSDKILDTQGHKTALRGGNLKIARGVLALPVEALELLAEKKLILKSKSGANVEIHGLNNLVGSSTHQLSAFVEAKQNTTKLYFGKTIREKSSFTVPVKVLARYQNNELKFYGLNKVTPLVNLNLGKSKWKKINATKLAGSYSQNRDLVNRTPREVLSIGIWDLGAWLGSFPAFLELMNKAQRKYKFTPVTATVPAGMLRRKEGVLNWIKESTTIAISNDKMVGILSNTIANDYFAVAEKIRTDLNLDYLVGITPGMVAGVDDNEVYWNHFSSMKNRLLIASTYDLRRFSSETNRPFNLFLAEVILAQLLVTQFYKGGLGYHVENSGCLFDYNGDRESLKEKIKNPHIDQACLELIPSSYRPSVLSLLNLFIKQSKEVKLKSNE